MLPTRSSSRTQSNQDSGEQLQDILMRELFDAINPHLRPEHYSPEAAAIYAKRYIEYLKGKVSRMYTTVTHMGATKRSLVNITQRIAMGSMLHSQ